MALINAIITVKGNTLITELPKNYFDIYEELLSVGNRKWIELFKSLQCLNDYFKPSDQPQWDKVINSDEIENIDEDDAPVIGI